MVEVLPWWRQKGIMYKIGSLSASSRSPICTARDDKESGTGVVEEAEIPSRTLWGRHLK